MAVVNVTGAQAVSATWDLVADEYHATGSVTLNAGVVITLACGVGATFRFDGAFNMTSSTSGRFVTTGTSATNRAVFCPNGASSTWSAVNLAVYINHTGSSGYPTFDYCDLYYVHFLDAHASGNASITNCRIYVGRAGNVCTSFSPSGGTNTYQNIEAWGNGSGGIGFASGPTGGTNLFDSLYAHGCATGFNPAPTGGTNTYSNLKAVRCSIGWLQGGSVASTYTNISLIDCAAPYIGQVGTAAATLFTRMMIQNPDASQQAIAVTPVAGRVHTFNECYVGMDRAAYGILNGGAVADVVFQNGVVASYHRSPISASGIQKCTSSTNDVVTLSGTHASQTGVLNGTCDNDYIAGANAAFAGAVPSPIMGALSDWNDPNFAWNVDVDSGNDTSTSVPVQYRTLQNPTGTPVNRTNPIATPHLPTSYTAGPTVTATTSQGATITATTGIKARSRILLSTVTGVTPLNAEIYGPWKYDGILNPVAPTDFTLPVTSHSHTLTGLKANTLYYYRYECFDPCGRRFMSTQSSFTTGVLSALAVDTTSLDAAQLTKAYHEEVHASGGATPYTWDISVGALPAGLSIAAGTGIITGTPTVAGTTNFTVRVTDGLAVTATLATSITVNSAGGPGFVSSLIRAC